MHWASDQLASQTPITPSLGLINLLEYLLELKETKFTFIWSINLL